MPVAELLEQSPSEKQWTNTEGLVTMACELLDEEAQRCEYETVAVGSDQEQGGRTPVDPLGELDADEALGDAPHSHGRGSAHQSGQPPVPSAPGAAPPPRREGR